MRQRLTPLMACSTPTRTLLMTLLAAAEYQGISRPRGFAGLVGLGTRYPVAPWKPVSWSTTVPAGTAKPLPSASFLSCMLPAAVGPR